MENHIQQHPVIIGVHGKPRSGKDSICNRLLTHLKLLRHGPSVQVKKTAAVMFDVPEEYFYDDKMKEQIDPYWGISYREMAQKAGKECSRDIFGEDFWMRHVDRFLLYKLPSQYNGIILADIRYANEAEWVTKHGGKVIFVTRKNRPQVSNEGHDAERGLDESLADIIIANDGSYEDLHAEVDRLVNIYWSR